MVRETAQISQRIHAQVEAIQKMSEDTVLVRRDVLLKLLDRLENLEKDLEQLKKKVKG